MRAEWKEKRMAAMFLLRADSFPEESTASWTYVVAIVQAPVNKAMPDTKWTHRHRVRAPRGSTSTSVIGEKARERGREQERERGMNRRQCYFQWCWVSRWESRISYRTHTHVHLHAVRCTLMHVKSVCVFPQERGWGQSSQTIWKQLDMANQHWYTAQRLTRGQSAQQRDTMWFNSL